VSRTIASSPLPLAPPDLDLTGIDPFFQPTRASFWLLVILLVNGLFSIGQLFVSGFRVVPVAALLGLLAWGIYTAGFVAVFRAMDLLDQHPPAGYVLAFAWGGLGAAHLSAPANRAIERALRPNSFPRNSWTSGARRWPAPSPRNSSS